MSKIIHTLSDGVDRCSRYAVVCLFALAFVSVLYQVFSRYVLQSTFVSALFPNVDFAIFNFAWIEEFIRYVFVWVVFLGIGMVYKRKGHAQAEILTSFLPQRWRRRASLFVELINAAFFILLLWKGYQMIMMTRGQHSPALQLDMGWMYLSILVCSVVCLLHSCAALTSVLARRTVIPLTSRQASKAQLTVEQRSQTKVSV